MCRILLFSEMGRRFETTRRHIQEDNSLSHLCEEVRFHAMFRISSSDFHRRYRTCIRISIGSGIGVREESKIQFCRYSGIKCKAYIVTNTKCGVK
jgi:hypothetical protein